jgi:hypothetical protein
MIGSRTSTPTSTTSGWSTPATPSPARTTRSCCAEFIAFWLSGGRVLAGMSVNIWDVTADIATLVRSGRQVDLDALADPDVPITDV